MAIYELNNGEISIQVESLGAELKSLKDVKTNQEYMWEGRKEFWGRTSPVLFPFVGAPKNKEYRYEGRTYPMGQHGFARDMEFTLEAQEEKSIWFVLSSTEETYVKYPFRFRLHIGQNVLEADQKDLGFHKTGKPRQAATAFLICSSTSLAQAGIGVPGP